jgi:putative ABC transport system ATP-binding protein
VLLDEHSTILSVLRLVAVTKRFGGRTVLNGVSLYVAAGEYVAILGESGIGKSTLLNAIAGLEPVDSGSIVFAGQELTSLDDDALTLLRRGRYGFIFQAFHVLPQLSVAQNVELPLLLRGIPDKGKVRQMLARALVGEPALVLADEPTGNLDPENARSVIGLIGKLVREKGAAAILATHSEQAAAGCDRRYRLSAQGIEPLA